MLKESKTERIESWLNSEKVGPWTMQVQPTDKCNLNCRFCWRNCYKRTYKELSKEKWISIIKDACDLGVRIITLVGGGEPLVRKETSMAIAEEVKKHNAEGCIVTNGTLFSNDMIKGLVKMGWDNITFSVNGADSKTDDYLRGKAGCFNKTVMNIKKINDIKKSFNSKLPLLTFHTVITRYNYNQPAKILNLAKKLKLGIVLFRMVNEGPSGKEGGVFSINKKQAVILLRELEKAKKLAKSYKIMLKQEFDEEEIKRQYNLNQKSQGEDEKNIEKENNQNKESPICVKPFSEVVVLADGTIHPCCVICESKYKNDFKDKSYLDNISNKNFKEIWYGKKFNSLRKSMMTNKLPKECSFYCTQDMVFRQRSKVIYANEW